MAKAAHRNKFAGFVVIVSLLALGWPAQAGGQGNPHPVQIWHAVATHAVLPSQGSLAGSAQPQIAEANANDGAQFVRSLGDEVVAILKSHPHKQRKQKFHDIFTTAFDVDAMAQFAAGNYWRRADDRQKQEYVKLFADYVATLYANKFADYAGQSFKVVSERASGETVAVEGLIAQSQQAPLRFDFRLRKSGSGFKVVDVYVEGMSLLITKRDEFMTVLSREGMDGLLQRLRTVSQG